ncbi:MAG: SGNH/GDSL hydrolase family protein [DPANN group archaeon]|nr:SGNH/GDSL hydrolase family protein [DPANN group archaeon]
MFIKNVLVAIVILILLFLATEFFLILYVNNTGLTRFSNNTLLLDEFIPGKEQSLFGANVKINSKGLRDYEYSYEKPDNIFRIVAIGDSFTFGHGIELNETYIKQLEKKLNQNSSLRYEVINFGFPAYNVLQNYEMMKSRALRFNPDLIMLGYFLNDPEFIPGMNPLIQYCKENKSVIDELNINIFEKSKIVRFLIRYYTTFVYEKKIAEFGIGYFDYINSEKYLGWNCTKKIFNQINLLSKRNNIPVLLIIIPHYDVQMSTYERIVNLSKKNGFYVLNFHTYFLNISDEEVYTKNDKPHFNREGNKIISDSIYDFLKKERKKLI